MSDNFEGIVEELKVNYGKVNSYKDLLVWHRSMELVEQIYTATTNMPENEKFGLTNQVRRASGSVASNIAEGWGVAVTGNYIHHLKIAFGSLCEVETQLLLIEKLSFVSVDELSKPKNTLIETSKMLKSLIISLERNKKN